MEASPSTSAATALLWAVMLKRGGLLGGAGPPFGVPVANLTRWPWLGGVLFGLQYVFWVWYCWAQSSFFPRHLTISPLMTTHTSTSRTSFHIPIIQNPKYTTTPVDHIITPRLRRGYRGLYTKPGSQKPWADGRHLQRDAAICTQTSE